MNIVKPSKTVRFLYPNRLWQVKTEEPVLYLTFDDGPIPEVTPWVLEVLEKYNAKATFFCVGENVEKHGTIYQQILKAGHQTANHTFNHLQGVRTKFSTYIANIEKAAELIESEYFRPPHGLLTHWQSSYIRKHLKMKIVMWDVLAMDYSPKISPENCYQNVIDNTDNGSIIVFHDSLKAENNLKYTLPKTLDYYYEKGYSFHSLAEI